MSEIKTLNSHTLADTAARKAIDRLSGEAVKTVNGAAPDETGNVVVSVEVDTTLTRVGAAADAAAAGEKLNQLTEEIAAESKTREAAINELNETIAESNIKRSYAVKDHASEAGTGYMSPNIIWFDENDIAAGVEIESVSVRCGDTAATNDIVVGIWEVSGDTLTLAETFIGAPVRNGVATIRVDRKYDTPVRISYLCSGFVVMMNTDSAVMDNCFILRDTTKTEITTADLEKRYHARICSSVVVFEVLDVAAALEALKVENVFTLSGAASHMTVTVIDDDTDDVEQVNTFYDKCLAAGIKGTFACITGRSTASEELKEKLLEYQSEGFCLAYHCHSQIAAYNSGDSRDYAAAQRDFVQGLLEMRTLGFLGDRWWVNPFGVTDEETQTLAKKYGLDCMVTVNQDYESKESKNRFCINRVSLYTERIEGSSYEQQDIENPAWYQYNFEKLKELVNECAAVNGWLLICTHMWGGGRTYWAESNRLTEFVEYVKSVAPTAQFKTLGEAYTERAPIYRLHEMR